MVELVNESQWRGLLYKNTCNIQELRKLYRRKCLPENDIVLGNETNQNIPDRKVEQWLLSSNNEDICREEKVYIKVNVPLFPLSVRSENVIKASKRRGTNIAI